MTCREKLNRECSWKVSDTWIGGCCGCPSDYYHIPRSEYCDDPYMTQTEKCTKCWDREIPETETVETIKEGNENMTNNTTTKKTKADLLNEIAELKKELENLDKYRQYEQVADELAAMRDAFIAKGFTREEAISFIFNAMNSLTK